VSNLCISVLESLSHVFTLEGGSGWPSRTRGGLHDPNRSHLDVEQLTSLALT
jgi:hypothetical protein